MQDKEWPSVSHSDKHRLPVPHSALYKTDKLFLRQKDITGEDVRNKSLRTHLQSKACSIPWVNLPVSDHGKSACSTRGDVRPYHGLHPR